MSRMFYATCVALCLALTLAQKAQARQAGDFKEAAAQYLARHEPQLQQTADPTQRMSLLLNVAPAALSAGEAGKATAYARELLTLGEGLKSGSGIGFKMSGSATHVGNLVLGRLALQGGDVGKAREHLLAAGRVSGSPVLKSFGPNMLLAKELVERGERETVVEYFHLCGKFWEHEGGKLGRWEAVVKQGGTPDFGPNLSYALMSWRFAP